MVNFKLLRDKIELEAIMRMTICLLAIDSFALISDPDGLLTQSYLCFYISDFNVVLGDL